MDNNRTVVFEARGDGVVREFDRIKASADQLMGDMLREATEYSDISRQQVEYIEQQIRAIEKRNRLLAETRAFEGGGQLTAEQAGEARSDRMQTELLRSILDELKVQSREEIAADKEGVQTRLRQARRASFIASLSPEQQFILGQQGALMNEEQGSRGGWFGGMLAGAGGGAMRAGNFAVGGLMAPAAMLASIPIIGTLLDRMVNLGTQLGSAQRGFVGRTGITNGLFGYDVTADIGIGQTDFLNYARALAGTRGGAGTGNVNTNLQQETANLLFSEAAYGLDPQTLIGLSRYQMMDTNLRGTAGDVQNFIKIMKSEGLFEGNDFSRLQRMLEGTIGLMEAQARTTEDINSNTMMSRVAMFQRVGGSFADQRTFDRIQQMNQAITNPRNDFAQAFLYGTLRQLAPEASFEELQMLQEEGIFGQTDQGTVLGQTLRNIQSRGGGRRMMMQNLSALFGLSMQQSRTLADAFIGDNMIFDDMSNINRYLEGGDDNVRAMAEANTPPVVRLMTNINEIMARYGKVGVDYVDENIRSLLNLGDGATGDAELNQYMQGLGKAVQSGDVAAQQEFQGKARQRLSQLNAPQADAISLSRDDKLIGLSQVKIQSEQLETSKEILEAQRDVAKYLMSSDNKNKENVTFKPE